MREVLPSFFGFQSVGIILRDQQTQELFTFVDTFDNRVLKDDKAQEKNHDRGINALHDVVTMKLPSTLGLTGLVYRSDEIFICQNVQKELRYNADVDNLGGNTHSANNLIVG